MKDKLTVSNTRICSALTSLTVSRMANAVRREQIRVFGNELGGKLLRLYDRIVIRRRK